MKLLMNFEITKGYDHWKSVFIGNQDKRQEAGIKTVFFGGDKNNPKKVHVCFEVESLEKVQEFMHNPDIAAEIKSSGHNVESTVRIPLVD